MISSSVVIFIVLFASSFANNKFIGPCELSALNRDECLRFKFDKLIELIPRMKDKNDEFSIDNFEMKDIQSDIGGGNISILRFKFEDFMNFKILNFKTEYDKDQKSLIIFFNFSIQLLKVLSAVDVDFHFTGEMAQFKDLKTKGSAQAVFENVFIDAILKTETVTENDYSFLKPIDLKGNLNCPSMRLFNFNFLSVPKNRFHNVVMNTLIKEYFYKLCDILVNNFSLENTRNMFFKKLESKLEDFEVIL